MISVVVLTYNQEQYIRQTLDSILMQQVDEPVEIIIGDDHSSDATSDICRNYQKQYPDKIRYFYNTPNLGLVANFIAMLKQCRGDYCALCDGDDYWITADKLQRQVDIMRQHKDCVLVHTHRHLLVNNQVVEQNPLALGYAQEPKNLLHFCFVNVPTVFFRLNIVRDFLPEYERLSLLQDWRMQDYPLWLYLGTKGSFRYIPDAMVHYRVLNNTLSREKDRSRACRFDASVITVRKHFYSLYLPLLTQKEQTDFAEMEFHFRKRMLLDYGWAARGQIIPLLKMLPHWQYICMQSIKRKLNRRK